MINTHWLVPKIKSQPTKTFELQPDNSWKKISDYPLMKRFKGVVQQVDDLSDFYSVLKEVSNKNAFFIHGEFIQGIDTSDMFRRSRSDKGDPTICNSMCGIFAIDIDDYDYDDDSAEEAIESFIDGCLPVEFSKASYVYQFSSSFGLTSGNKLKAHLFFQPIEPIHNSALYKWARSLNHFANSNIIDESIYKAVQPVYTRHRIITISKDHENWDDIHFDPNPIPIDEMIGFVDKGKLLDWAPSDIESVQNKNSDDESEVDIVKLVNPEKFDLSSSIRKIMTSEDFHKQIRSTALSLINKNVSPKDTRIFIEEFMLAAKVGIKDADRIQDWQNRFEDIPRAVESAVEIVNIPNYNDVIEWIKISTDEQIQVGFAKKLMNFSGAELKLLVRAVDKKIDVGPRAINEDIKGAIDSQKEELKEIARELKSEERTKQGIFEIEITNSTYGAATTAICKVLANSKKKPEVYKLGNTLSIIEHSIPKTIRQITRKGALKDDYPSMPIVHNIDSPVGIIRNRVEKDCVFINETGKEIVCPDSILNAVPRMYGINWNPLSGIVEHPYIDDNWNLVEKTGYDPNTGLYAELHKKLKITLIDPEKAYRYLAEKAFAEFPFQTNLDKATAIGMFMTAVQRPYVTGDNGMPGYAIVSPKPSSGKTTLAQLLSYSIYNRPVAATGWSDNDEELGKHLLAILREGHACVLFDNIKKDAAVASNELAKAMTSGTYSRRKLGVNETEEVPSSVLWLFTGNNIVFKGDFATRILPIRLVPRMEHPEFRKFNRQDIGKWAMDNRKKILSAILSIVMVGKNINMNDNESSARFKEWNRFVRLPLMKISGEDLLDVFDRNDFMDDEMIAKGELLEMLFNTFGSKPFITRDIMHLMEGISVEGANVATDSSGSEFKHAITEAFNDKATQNIKTLGRFILGMKDFILRGYMLVRHENSKTMKTMATWRVVKNDEQLED